MFLCCWLPSTASVRRSAASLFLGPSSPRERYWLWQRVLSYKAGGIHFEVLGYRWSSNTVYGLAVSFVLSISLAFARKNFVPGAS